MGYGSYKATDWSKLKTSRKIEKTSSETEVFTKTEMDPRFDPKFITAREARDSKEHPNTTPIIIGLDVTGSMGYLSHQIATESLHETMLKMYSTNPVADPAMMFAAYGDYADRAPLQVTQFESDIRIAEQLLDLWIENHGSGMVVPNYLWYFAAKHTELDCIRKHDKKGFLFTIGDAADCRTVIDAERFKSVFNETCTMDTQKIVEEAQKKFDLFHIFIDDMDKKATEIVRLLPGRTMVIHRNDIGALPEIIISAMQISEGKNSAEVLAQWGDLNRPIVERAIKDLAVGNKKKGFFF